jgi:hypothetical protein
MWMAMESCPKKNEKLLKKLGGIQPEIEEEVEITEDQSKLTFLFTPVTDKRMNKQTKTVMNAIEGQWSKLGSTRLYPTRIWMIEPITSEL